MMRNGRFRRTREMVTQLRQPAIRNRSLEPFQNGLRELFRLLNFLLLIARATYADPDVTVPFQNIQRSSYPRSGPERFVAETRDFQWLLSFIVFFLFPGGFFAMKNFAPTIARVAPPFGFARNCHYDRIHRRRRFEVAL